MPNYDSRLWSKAIQLAARLGYRFPTELAYSLFEKLYLTDNEHFSYNDMLDMLSKLFSNFEREVLSNQSNIIYNTKYRLKKMFAMLDCKLSTEALNQMLAAEKPLTLLTDVERLFWVLIFYWDDNRHRFRPDEDIIDKLWLITVNYTFTDTKELEYETAVNLAICKEEDITATASDMKAIRQIETIEQITLDKIKERLQRFREYTRRINEMGLSLPINEQILANDDILDFDDLSRV